MFNPFTPKPKMNWMENPQIMGLLQAGLGILGAKGTYGALGPALSQGGLLGLQGLQQAKQMQNQENDRRFDRYVAGKKLGFLEQEQNNLLSDRNLLQGGFTPQAPAQAALAAGGGPTVQNAVTADSINVSGNPTEAGVAYQEAQHWKNLLAQAKTKEVRGIISDQYKNAYNKFIDLTKQDQSPATKDIAIGNGMEQAHQYDRASGRWRPIEGSQPRPIFNPNPLVTIAQEKEEAKKVGGGFGEQYVELQKSAMNAQSKIDRWRRLGSLLEGVNTGKLTPAGTELAAWADSIGLKVDKNLGNKQAAEALSNEIALTLRNPSGGAGMPGALSDKDREFLRSMVPDLSKTPQGRKLMIDTAVKLAEREKEVARLARAYRKKHRAIDEGFYDELEEFANQNPLFPAGATPVDDPLGIR